MVGSEGRGEGIQTHLLSLSGKDDDGGEDQSDERERSNGGEELGLVELLGFDENEKAASQESESEWDAFVGGQSVSQTELQATPERRRTEEGCYATSDCRVGDMSVIRSVG